MPRQPRLDAPGFLQIEEPELRDVFVLRMRNIDLEKTIIVEDFGRRYGLK